MINPIFIFSLHRPYTEAYEHTKGPRYAANEVIQTGVCSTESCSGAYFPNLLSVDNGYCHFFGMTHTFNGGIEAGVPEVWLLK